LGRTGTAQDAASLLAVREKNPAASEAALDLAARLGPKGASIYRTLAAEGEPPLIRAAALEGLFNTDPKAALPLLQSAARTPDPVLQSRAIRCLVAHGHAAWLMEQVASFAPRAQVWVLTALTERKSPGARPLFLRAIDSPEPEIRLAGLQGLAAFGTQDDVLLLATRAASSEGPEQEAARGSLWRLADPGVDATIRSAIVSAESPIQAELVRACAERGLAEATPQVITVFQSGDRNVRREALRALRDIAPADSLPSLVPLLAAATAGTEKREAERMLASTLKRHPETGLDPILKTYRSASSSEDRTSLLSVLGQAGRPEALPLFTEVLSAPDATLRRAAILALTEWPTQAPATELLRVAGADAEQPLRILALRGYIRLVSQPSELTPAESVSQLKAALAMNPPVEEKRAVLAALPRFVCPEALQVAKALAQDSTVAAEAQTAASRLENSLKYRQ
jgi:HEAT repeat protein